MTMVENYWRFPAEWEPQEGVLLCFPPNGNDWPGKLGAIQWAMVEFIKKVASVENVFLIVASLQVQRNAAQILEKAHVQMNRVKFIKLKTNRAWMRDSGPIIIKKGNKLKAMNFNFNGWAKYANYRLDRKVPSVFANLYGIPICQAAFNGKPLVLEGGALEVNGKGTLITTEECLLDTKIQVRNSGLSKEDYESIFKKYFGVTHTIWLKKGVVGDDTHGHIDDLARFVNEDTIVTVVEENPQDENYLPLKENLEILRDAVLQDGQKPNIVVLPMPNPIYFEGIRLPASYANFLIINHAVLVPTFNDENDQKALNILAECFPDRNIIGINAIDLIWGFGTLHCLSQQIPKA